ncbi:MAG: hypothetical protein DRO99_03690 [Candidatus Aenigmatarchaeota archaeon]|nr:MAG: hypothetical protein DRO99_03690 [Candidatus Aenigmarchaeota archaeon]
MDLLLFFMPMVLILGVVTSYDDIRHERIRNKWTGAAIVYAFLVLFLITFNSYMAGLPIEMSYFSDYAINLTFSLLVAMFIWYSGLWSAGDAKLFIAYTALLPLSVYQFVYFQTFLSFTILVNTFIPLFIYFFIKAFVKTDMKTKIQSMKRSIGPKIVVKRLISILGISALANTIVLVTGMPGNIFIILFMVLAIHMAMEKVFKDNMMKAAIVLACIVSVYRFDYVISWGFLNMFLVIFFLFVFVRYFILNLSYGIFTTPIYIENIKPGMVLAEDVFLEGKRYKRRPILQYSILPDFSDERKKSIFESRYLNKSDVDKIKKLHSSGKFKPHSLRVNDNVPFAPMMFLGVIITILINRSLIAFLMAIFNL